MPVELLSTAKAGTLGCLPDGEFVVLSGNRCPEKTCNCAAPNVGVSTRVWHSVPCCELAVVG